MEKRKKVEALLELLVRKIKGKEGSVPLAVLSVNATERLKALNDLKILGRSVENADPIYTDKVSVSDK